MREGMVVFFMVLFCRNDDVAVQLMMGYWKGKRVMKRVLPMLSDVRIITFKSLLFKFSY